MIVKLNSNNKLIKTKIVIAIIMTMMNVSKSIVTVVGGGNSAHVLIPFLGASGHQVNLLTRRPEAWSKIVTCEMQRPSKKEQMMTYGNVNHPPAATEVLQTVKGTLSTISSDPSDVIPQADILVLCMPVHQYRNALNVLAPYIDRKKENVFVGTVYGQAGFNWMVHEMERNYDLHNICTFACGLIPWICRTVEYGKIGANYGTKMVNIAAVTPRDKFNVLDEIFLKDIAERWHGKGAFHQACSFLSLTLSVDNQIIHPSRCYGLWKRYDGRWETENDVPYFYKDFDDLSAQYIQHMDSDYSKVRNAVRKMFPERDFKYMLDYFRLEKLTHESSHENIKQSFKNSEQLALIKTPTLKLDDGSFALDTTCRFFTDDIPYGVLVAKWVAEKLHVETPFIDEILDWAGYISGEQFLVDGKVNLNLSSGIPPSYGIDDVKKILD